MGFGFTFGADLYWGRATLLFVVLLLWAIVALRCGFRWALHGSGYWPRGVPGRMLFAVSLLLVPAAVVLLVKTFGTGLEKQPSWYRPLGARPTAVPAASLAVERHYERTSLRLSPLRPVG